MSFPSGLTLPLPYWCFLACPSKSTTGTQILLLGSASGETQPETTLYIRSARSGQAISQECLLFPFMNVGPFFFFLNKEEKHSLLMKRGFIIRIPRNLRLENYQDLRQTCRHPLSLPLALTVPLSSDGLCFSPHTCPALLRLPLDEGPPSSLVQTPKGTNLLIGPRPYMSGHQVSLWVR